MVKITVVMPIYNAERFLAAAVESILNQTFHDFELIAINDGSSDNSSKMLDNYQQRDNRVRVHNQPRNMGVAVARTTGCELAVGEFIAQMDSDDISLPTRFEKQIEFLEMHPEIGGCGTWIEYINQSSELTGRIWKPAPEPLVLRWTLIFGMQIAHPTWMMRKSLAQSLDYYRPINVEDYDLIVRASHITQIANVPEILLHYRYWSQSKSTVNAKTEAPTSARIVSEEINTLIGGHLSVEDALRLQKLISGHLDDTSSQQVKEFAHIIEQAYHQYRTRYTLTASDARKIATDASVKLLTCAALIAKQSPTVALSILNQSLKISPTAPIPFAQKVVKNLRERRASV